MKLSVRASDGSVKVSPETVFKDLLGLFVKLISEQVHEVLHQVTLSHQQILLKVDAVLLKVVALLQDLQQLSVSLLASFLDPLLQLCDVKTLVDIERCLEVQLQCPALHVAALTNEVD